MRGNSCQFYERVQDFPKVVNPVNRVVCSYESRVKPLFQPFLISRPACCNPTLRKCGDETHTPKVGTWESSGTPKTLEFNGRGQNTLHWGILYIIGKLLKCRCRKRPCMTHLDIYSTSYGKKRLGIKLTIWLPTTKSGESTRLRCV